MENLKVMTHDQFGKLTVVIIDGKEMFKAKEVAEMLGYQNTSLAIKQHCKSVTKHKLETSKGKQEVNLIPEGDVWRLIIRSKLPQAEAIEKWIMEEVLPSIRKTGSYRIQANPMYHPEITDYKYQTKLYDGETVLNTADISYFLDLAPDQIKKIRDAMMTEGIHYFKLSGEELKKFKVKHRLVRSTAKSMYLYNYEGYHLLEIYFAEYSQHPTRKKKPQPQFVVLDRERPTMPPEDMKQVVPNVKTKVLMNNVKEHCMAANGLAQTLLSVYTRGELKVIRKALVNEIFALETMAKQIEGIKF